MGVVTKNVPRPLRARTLHLKILDPPLRSTTESRLMESGSFTGATEPEKSEGAKALPGHCHEDGANPDMVAVSLRCSCKLGCVQDSHLQALLVSLYEVSNNCTTLHYLWCSGLFVEILSLRWTLPQKGYTKVNITCR